MLLACLYAAGMLVMVKDCVDVQDNKINGMELSTAQF
jgi:hypothetical protein